MCTPTSMIMYYVLETGYGLFLHVFLTVVASNPAILRVRQINIEISFHAILISTHVDRHI